MIAWTNEVGVLPQTGLSPAGLQQAGPPRAGAGAEHEPPGPAAHERGALVELAGRVAEAVMTCPDVTGMTSGPHGWIATHRAGPPLPGVAVRPAEIEIGVVVRYGRPCPEIAGDVRRLVRPLAGARRVDVLIGDLAEDG